MSCKKASVCVCVRAEGSGDGAEIIKRMDEGTYVAHVLREQVLQRLAHGVALGHDALAPVVARAGRVSHERRAADDALQALLQ